MAARNKSPEQHYDVIVIGAGIAGLSAANYLARGGKRVLILEQNHQAGGCMSGFWREGFYFDAGDQSFESAGIMFPILKELGVYDLHRWERVEYRIKSPHYDFVARSLDVAEAEMQKAFPDETGLKPVFDEFRRASEFLNGVADPWQVKLVESPALDLFVNLFRKAPGLFRWMDPEAKEEIFAPIRDEELRNWFINAGYVGLPFFLLAGFWYSWSRDYWYPAGGMQSLMDSLVKKFQDLGGEVRFKTPAGKILVRDGKVEGVLPARGEVIAAEHVVYSGDYKKLVLSVLGERYYDPGFIDTVRRARVTEPVIAAYLGLDIPPEELAKIVQAHHVMCLPGYETVVVGEKSDIDVHARMWVDISTPCMYTGELSPPGKSSLVIQTMSSARWHDWWGNKGPVSARTKEYRDLKRKVALQLIETATSVIPGLKEKIVYMDLGSPLSSERFTMNTEGASAGWAYRQPPGPSVTGKWGHLKLTTPVRNLYTCGHYTLWPGGVPTAAMSGKIAAGLVLKKSPFTQLERLGRVLGLVKRLPVLKRHG